MGSEHGSCATTPARLGSSMSSDARWNTPCRFDIGLADQDLRECCNACLFTSIGRGSQIAVMRAAGRSICAIARALQRAKSTVPRELRRNGLSSRRYSPLHAAGAHQLRRRREAIIEKDQKLRTFVCDRLAEGWTPEQIAGWLKAGNERRLRALRDDLRLYLSPLPKGRTTLALSHAPSQTPASAPIEALARYDQRSILHP